MSHRCQKLSPLLQNDWITGAQQDKHDKHVKGAEEGQGSPVGPNAIQRTEDKNEKVESLSRGKKIHQLVIQQEMDSPENIYSSNSRLRKMYLCV